MYSPWSSLLVSTVDCINASDTAATAHVQYSNLEEEVPGWNTGNGPVLLSKPRCSFPPIAHVWCVTFILEKKMSFTMVMQSLHTPISCTLGQLSWCHTVLAFYYRIKRWRGVEMAPGTTSATSLVKTNMLCSLSSPNWSQTSGFPNDLKGIIVRLGICLWWFSVNSQVVAVAC